VTRCALLPTLLLATALAAGGCAHRSGVVSGAQPARVGGPAADGGATAAAPDAALAGEDGGAGEVTAGGGSPAAALGEVSDPLAPWNRAMFTFNDRLYFWVLKPVARGYRAVVPGVARAGVRNFFHNLTTPGRLVSDILQLKGREAAAELGKFMINTTWGGLGFGDWFAGNPAAKIPEQDVGLTLARYGVGNGVYVVWPVLGPSTARDSVGMVGDFFLDPASYLRPLTASAGVYTVREVNTTSFRIGDYESVKEAAIDPYVAIRQAYIQHRARALEAYEQPQNFIYP
jgi:phospholipid-binding lipoprotein MlaA